MNEMITLCGDNCLECPRFNKSDGDLKKAAELWYRVGFNDKIVSLDEIRCSGCSSHKSCTYGLVACIKAHNVEKCNQCTQFPCEKITSMLERSERYKTKCKKVCNASEYSQLEKAFFNKEENLKK